MPSMGVLHFFFYRVFMLVHTNLLFLPPFKTVAPPQHCQGNGSKWKLLNVNDSIGNYW